MLTSSPKLALPFTVDIHKGEATYYTSSKTLYITVPIVSTFAPEDNTTTANPSSAPERQMVPIRINDLALESEYLAGAHEIELAIVPQPAPATTTTEKKGGGETQLPFMQKLTRETYMKMLADDSNKEEASYSRLYEDVEEFHSLKKRNPSLLAQPAGGLAAGSSAADAAFEQKMKKVKRNDACPCGSGKKFKACHGKE